MAAAGIPFLHDRILSLFSDLLQSYAASYIYRSWRINIKWSMVCRQCLKPLDWLDAWQLGRGAGQRRAIGDDCVSGVLALS